MKILFQLLGYAVILTLVYLNFVFYTGVEVWLEPRTLVSAAFYACAVTVGYLFVWFRKNETAKREWTESLKEGAIEEKQIFRELTDLERIQLDAKYKEASKIRSKYWLLVPFFLAVDVAALLTTAWLLQRAVSGAKYFEISLISTLLLVFFFLFFLLQTHLFKKGDKEGIYYADLRSPVLKIQGAIVKQRIKRKNSTTYKIFVRGLQFTRENYPDLENFFNGVSEGDEVAVEYSPRTKHVWKIYKTTDI